MKRNKSNKAPDKPVDPPSLLDDSMLDSLTMPADMRCPKCGSRMVEQWLKGLGILRGMPLRVKCTKCNYHNSWYGHIGEMLFMVEELPQGEFASFKVVAPKRRYKVKKPKRNA